MTLFIMTQKQNDLCYFKLVTVLANVINRESNGGGGAALQYFSELAFLTGQAFLVCVTFGYLFSRL